MIQNNRCELPIYDIPFSYGADVIHCFERPMAAALHFYNSAYTGLYLTLAKFRGVYSKGSVKEQVYREIQSLFGIEIIEQKKPSYREICQVVEQGIPMIVGVNLKEIFYSNYYKSGNWGHWLLVKGYRPVGELVTVLDNTQFEEMGHEYGTFPIPFSMLQKANSSYRKSVDTAYSCMQLLQRKTVEPQEVLHYILKEYGRLDLKQEKNYKQLELLSVLQEIPKNQGVDQQYYGNELKKKLINVNKYRKLFHERIEYYMREYGFEPQKEEAFHNHALKLQELWDVFMMKKTLEAARGEFQSGLPESIVDAELMVQKLILEFLKHLEMMQVSPSQKASAYEFENNQEGIISETEQEFQFRFNGTRTYNWWEKDEAPKVLLRQDIIKEGFCAETTVCILKGEESRNYEAGLFIRNKENGESFLLGIENQENLVWDETNVTGHKLHIDKRENYPLTLRYEAGMLIGELGEKVYFQYDYPSGSHVEVGLVCKTWGIGGPLILGFRDVR